MKFTKTFGQSRLKVAVLNPELIPELVDVVIGDFVYELQFRAEKEDQSDDPKPIDMEAPLDDDKHGEDDGPEQMEEDARDVPKKCATTCCQRSIRGCRWCGCISEWERTSNGKCCCSVQGEVSFNWG